LESELVIICEERDSFGRQLKDADQRKLAELARLADERLRAEESLTRQNASTKAQILDLELQLTESQELHAQQLRTSQKRIRDLEQQLKLSESQGAADGALELQLKTSRKSVVQLEEQLWDSQAADETLKGQLRRSETKNAELERELKAFLDGEGALKRRDSMNSRTVLESQEKIVDLERLLEMSNSSETRYKSEITVIRESMQRGELVAGELERRIATVMQELVDERHQLAIARQELSDCKVNLEQFQRDATAAIESQDQVAAAQRLQMEERVNQESKGLDQANVTITELRAELRELLAIQSKQVTTQSKQVTTEFSSNAKARQSFVGTLTQSRDFSIGTLLPGSTEGFVIKVREATKTVVDAMKKANDIHVRCIDSQIKSGIESMANNRSMQDGFVEYADRLEIETERRSVAEEIEANVSDLSALREELQIQHQLSDSDQQEISAWITLDLGKCNEDLTLLRYESALGQDVPDTVLQMLSGNIAEWDDGFSPMHWAAKNGRRDMMLFLLETEIGKSMLETRDKYGRTPLYYAQKTKRVGLIHWLKNDVGANSVAPVQASQPRPSMNDLPPAYQKVLTQIETYGWQSMNWREGYSMLHWAASKGNKDVCKYLVELNADQLSKDDQGRTAVDIAKENDKELANFLLRLGGGRPSIVPGGSLRNLRP